MTKSTPKTIAECLDNFPDTWFHWRLATISGLALMIGGLAMELIPLSLVIMKKEWNLTVTEVSWMMTTAQIITFLATIYFGKIAKYFGIKPLFLLTFLSLTFGLFFCAFAEGLYSFLFTRALLATGFATMLLMANTLVTETAPKAVRGQLVSFSQLFWPMGDVMGIAIGVILIPILGWRSVLMIGGALGLYAIYLYRNLPDSPRHLESIGRQSEALAEFRNIEKEVGMRPTEIVFEEKTAEEKEKHKKTSFFDMFRNGRGLRTTMLFFISFAANFIGALTVQILPTLMVSFGVSIKKTFSYILIFALAGAPALYLSTLLIDKWGRKILLGIYLFGALIALVSFSINTTQFTFLVATGCLLRFSMNGIRSGIRGYVLELMPAHLRVMGSSWAGGLSALGNICSLFLVGGISALWPNNKGYVFIPAIIVSVLCILMLIIAGVETKGKSLEESSK